jgi:hypothetical protein
MVSEIQTWQLPPELPPQAPNINAEASCYGISVRPRADGGERPLTGALIGHPR